MNRRYFIQSTAHALLVPSLLFLSDAAAAGWNPAGRFFYDDRFPLALRLARQLPAASGLTPVRSDITDIWNGGLADVCGHSTLILQGVTTESFHFCLQIMVGERAPMNSRISRIDRDLFLWQIQSLPTLDRRHLL